MKIMTKRKGQFTRKTSRRSWRPWRRKRVKHKQGMSIITTSAFAAAEFQAVAPAIPIFQSGDVMTAMKSLAHEHLYVWTGMNSGLFGGATGTIDVARIGGTYVPIIIGALVSKYLGKYVNPTIKQLPFVGKKLRL